MNLNGRRRSALQAQITLTPTEAKKFIARAIGQSEAVKKALAEGIIVLHPSSSTYFLVEELLGRPPETKVWVCGVIAPRGACVEKASALPKDTKHAGAGLPHHPREFSHSWVIEEGRFTTGTPLRELLARMGPGDLYVKGVNALDAAGNAGVLAGNAVEAGTIGLVLTAAQKKGFGLIFPAGLEKLIPVSIGAAVQVAKRRSYAYAMGMPVSLVPCPGGKTVTELDAAAMLAAVEAVPIAAGGLGGAGGAITFVVTGERERVERLIGAAEAVKGAALPPLRLPDCDACGARDLQFCLFPVKGKPWT